MSLIPTVYSSTDAGAPVLTGQVGTMAALLDAILVNGYGSGGAAKPALGWALAYTGTNLRAYRNNATTGTGYYLRLDDTQTRVARMRGYTAMTAISTGSGPTPTAAQRGNGGLWVKSITTNSTARKWWAIGNERCFYLFVATTDEYPNINQATINFAGDFLTLKAGDAHNFFVSVTEATTITDLYSTQSSLFYYPQYIYAAGSLYYYPCGFIGRAAAAVGGAVPAVHLRSAAGWDAIASGGNYGGDWPYPDSVTAGMIWEKAWIIEGPYKIRGCLPGLIYTYHKLPFPDLEILSTLPDFPSGTVLQAKSFIPLSPNNYTVYDSQVLFDLGAWT